MYEQPELPKLLMISLQIFESTLKWNDGLSCEKLFGSIFDFGHIYIGLKSNVIIQWFFALE